MSETSYSLPRVPMEEAMAGTNRREALRNDPEGYASGIRSAISFFEVAGSRGEVFDTRALSSKGWVGTERSCQDSNELHANCHGFVETSLDLARGYTTPSDYAYAFADQHPFLQSQLEGVSA